MIQKEEPKQETLEEAAEKEFPLIDTEWCRTGACEEENLQLLGHRRSFIRGAKWQQERSYSKEDMEKAFTNGLNRSFDSDFDRWFENFKN
jgi:predicted aldo/keto reductase-like oxidoreductase